METRQTDIPKIILKFLKGEELSVTEQDVFAHWLDANEANREFLKDMEKVDRIEADLVRLSQINAEEDWQYVNKRITPRRVTKLIGWRWILSAASVLVLAFFLFEVFQPEEIIASKNIIADEKNIYSNDVLPASNEAHIILGDGTIVNVNNNEDVLNKLIKDDDNISLGENSGTSLTPKAVADYNTLVVPKGAFFQISLSDGTKVWINAMSKLKFPAKFSNRERRVDLEGEAYFEVTHDQDRPFVVENKGAEIQVLGTEFNLNTYSEKVKTTLIKGSVQLFDSQGKAARLLPGQRADWSHGQISVKKADVERDIAWKNGEFLFHGETIGQILNEVSRWYDLDVKLVGKVSLEKQYSGSINRQAKLSEVLEMLKFVSKLDFDINGSVLIVKNIDG